MTCAWDEEEEEEEEDKEEEERKRGIFICIQRYYSMVERWNLFGLGQWAWDEDEEEVKEWGEEAEASTLEVVVVYFTVEAVR